MNIYALFQFSEGYEGGSGGVNLHQQNYEGKQSVAGSGFKPVLKFMYKNIKMVISVC